MDFEYYLYDVVTSVVEDFDYYGVNKITNKQWNVITQLASQIGNETEEVAKEADVWVQETLRECDCFTILGL